MFSVLLALIVNFLAVIYLWVFAMVDISACSMPLFQTLMVPTRPEEDVQVGITVQKEAAFPCHVRPAPSIISQDKRPAVTAFLAPQACTAIKKVLPLLADHALLATSVQVVPLARLLATQALVMCAHVDHTAHFRHHYPQIALLVSISPGWSRSPSLPALHVHLVDTVWRQAWPMSLGSALLGFIVQVERQ